jgi:hypothetical protein
MLIERFSSIIAMYGAVVILVAGKLRGVFTNSPLDCIIQEIPTADHLMKICLDIYICREAKDFVLEQVGNQKIVEDLPKYHSFFDKNSSKIEKFLIKFDIRN